MKRHIAYLRIALFHMLILPVAYVGGAFAIQIEPNPNPEINTITITPSTPRENLVSFSNLGTINIEPLASFHNTNRFDNSGIINNRGTITNSGTFTEIPRPGFLLLPEGSHFNNLASGVYNGGDVSTGISGTFVNEGAVTHGLGFIRVGETGQYIQQQSVGSSVSPTTITPDAPFTNAGRVHIAAGDFSIDPISIRACCSRYEQTSTGTTQIDARFQNIGGQVINAGAIMIGSTGEYRQQSPVPVGLQAGSTINTGTFTNFGTTNIGTGVFTNQGSVANSGAFTVGTTGIYDQTSTLAGVTPTTVNTGTFTNGGSVRIGEGTVFSNFPTLALGAPPPVGGQYIQQAGGTTLIEGTFQNNGGRVTNEGAITVGSTGTYSQTRSAAPVGATPTTANTGSFSNAGSTTINAGTFSNQGSVVNSGKFEVGVVGQVSGAGSYSQTAAAAQTIVNGTFGNNITLQAGSLSGSGIITGIVANTGGVVRPGSSVLPGTLTLANYTQGIYGRLDLKIGGLLAGTQYDVLKVTGSGTFGGSLSVSSINGFTPGLGNRFDLLTCSLGCSGLNSGALFSGGVSLPSLTSGLAWISGLTDGGNSFSLTVVAAAVSAPEPGTLLLMASGLVGLVAWQRKRRMQNART